MTLALLFAAGLGIGFIAGLATWAITSFTAEKVAKIWYGRQLAQVKLELYNNKKAVDEKMEKIRAAYPEMTARQAKSLEEELAQGIGSVRQRK